MLGLGLLFLAASCSDNEGTLAGRVVDLFGNPVSARVSIRGQAREVQTDSRGRYRLGYVPGRFELAVEAPGYYSRTIPWDLYQPATVEAEPVVLVPRPSAPGLWVPGPQGYVAAEPKSLKVRRETVLGLSTGAVERFTVEGAPIAWCAGLPVILRTSESNGHREIDARRVGPGGIVRSERTPSRENSVPLHVTEQPVGDLWLDMETMGRIVLVVGERGGRWLPAHVYDVNRQDCGRSGRGPDNPGGKPRGNR